MRKAVDWLAAIQNEDGGWGEDGSSYKLDYQGYEPAPSTPSQTAWALLGLMAAGEVEHPAVERGVAYLAQSQGEDGLWPEERFTAVGFPRVFYLRYHGYAKVLPALGAGALPQPADAATAAPSPTGCRGATMTLHVSSDERLPVLMVTGLAKEMRLAEGPGLVAIASGGDTGAAAPQPCGADEPGCRAVLSFGIAGGLDPEPCGRRRGRRDRHRRRRRALADASGARRSARGVALGRRRPRQARRYRRRRRAAPHRRRTRRRRGARPAPRRSTWNCMSPASSRRGTG